MNDGKREAGKGSLERKCGKGVAGKVGGKCSRKVWWKRDGRKGLAGKG